jgi:hypothetical protein
LGRLATELHWVAPDHGAFQGKAAHNLPCLHGRRS